MSSVGTERIRPTRPAAATQPVSRVGISGAAARPAKLLPFRARRRSRAPAGTLLRLVQSGSGPVPLADACPRILLACRSVPRVAKPDDDAPDRDVFEAPGYASVVVTLATTVSLAVAALPIDAWTWPIRAGAALLGFFVTVQLFGRFPRLSEALLALLLSPVVAVLALASATGTAVLLLQPGISISDSLARAMLAGVSTVAFEVVFALPHLRSATPSGIRTFLVVSVFVGLWAGIVFVVLSGPAGAVRDTLSGAFLVGLLAPLVVSQLARAAPDLAPPPEQVN